MSDLDRLIEAVEAGDLTHDGSAYRSLGDGWLHVFDAMNGSLDAAKALHDALLPGWDYRIETGRRDVKARVSQTHLLSYYDPSSADTPARAWILAILRATQETQNDRA